MWIDGQNGELINIDNVTAIVQVHIEDTYDVLFIRNKNVYSYREKYPNEKEAIQRILDIRTAIYMEDEFLDIADIKEKNNG